MKNLTAALLLVLSATTVPITTAFAQSKPKTQSVPKTQSQPQPPGAPTIKPTENTIDEVFGLLKFMEAEAWRFDLSSFSDAEYRFTSYIEEFLAGEPVQMDNYDINITNWRTRHTDPDDWAKFLAEEKPRLSADGEKFLTFENMGIYILPKNDSIAKLQINFYEWADFSTTLKLRPLQNTEDNPRYQYAYRPFRIEPSEIVDKQRIPLLLAGSMWYDESVGVHRFCGVSEFAPDMSDEELKLIPHYYVIGIEVEKIN